MDAEKVKDRLVKYEKQYFRLFKQEDKPAFVSESVKDCFVICDPGYECMGEWKAEDITFVFRDTSKSTLLHEQIHFYLEWLPMSEIEFLAVVLADLIRNKISNYEKIVKEWFSFRQDFNYGMIEDKHDFCFFLVSLSLDLRLGFVPGTVYGYGLEEEFIKKGVRFKTK